MLNISDDDETKVADNAVQMQDVEVADNVIDVTALKTVIHDLSNASINPSTIIPKRDKWGRKRRPARLLTAQDAVQAHKKIRTTM